MPSKAKITPEDLEKITTWLLEGLSLRQIAKRLGVSHQAVKKRIERQVLPALAALRPYAQGHYLALLRHVYRLAMRQYLDTGDARHLKGVTWALERELELADAIAAQEDPLRVAGKTPEELRQEVLEELAQWAREDRQAREMIQRVLFQGGSRN